MQEIMLHRSCAIDPYLVEGITQAAPTWQFLCQRDNLVSEYFLIRQAGGVHASRVVLLCQLKVQKQDSSMDNRPKVTDLPA